MIKMTMPPKAKTNDVDDEAVTQTRPSLERYRLQVDRQTKSSFSNLADAEKAGAEIKKQFPVVRVSIFDNQKDETQVL